MMDLAFQQLLAVSAMIFLIMGPGWALGRLLELRSAVTPALLAPGWFVLGLGWWTIAVTIGLAVQTSILNIVAMYGATSLLLVGFAAMMGRRRSTPRSEDAPVSAWTVAVVVLSGIVAAAFRSRLAFDSLFHIGLARRIAELDHVTFDNLDRIFGAGVNPAYLIPSWQAAIAAVAAVTTLDPATVVEAMAGLLVVLGALAAAGFGRVVSGRLTGEIAAVVAFALMRVYYPRRELEGDGIAYAYVPGNITIDILFPLILGLGILLVAREGLPRRRVAMSVLAATATVLVVVLHANYVAYLVMFLVGLIVWLLVAGPWSRELRNRFLRVLTVLIAPGLTTLAAILPALMLLEHFAAPAERRITYYLLGEGATTIIRPGHLYDTHSVLGMIAMLLLPWGVWKMRGVARALVGGGALTMLLVAFVPPLLDLVSQSGSHTIAQRLPRAFGIVLIAAFAVAAPDIILRIREASQRIRASKGAWAARGVWFVAAALVVGIALIYGYPLVRQEPPRYGWNWPTIVAGVGMIFVFGLAMRDRRRGVVQVEPEAVILRTREMRADVACVGMSLLIMTLCLLPSGAMSLRRGAWQGQQFVASRQADDLGCAAGIERKLRELDAGSVLVADPVTGYMLQALAAPWLVGDFKTWNGKTDAAAEAERIALLSAAFDEEDPARAAAAIAAIREVYPGVRALVVASGEVEPPLDTPLEPFDAVGLRAALAAGLIPDAQRVASGPGRLPANATDADRQACSLSLWMLGATEDDGGDRS